MSLTYNGAFEAELCHLIGEHIEALKEELAVGAMELDRYRYKAGQIQGLRDTLEFCKEANRKIQER